MSAPSWGVWAWVCDACGHVQSGHLRAPGWTTETFAAGPFVCPCGCEIAQNAPAYGIDRATYLHHRERLHFPAAPPSPDVQVADR